MLDQLAVTRCFFISFLCGWLPLPFGRITCPRRRGLRVFVLTPSTTAALATPT
jgi:hypothetical protein